MFSPTRNIEKVIFVNLDSVLGSVITSRILKPAYGRIDIIHQLRQQYPDATDAEILLQCQRDVISTCWDAARTIAAVRESGLENVRLYDIGCRIEYEDINSRMKVEASYLRRVMRPGGSSVYGSSGNDIVVS